MPVVGRAALAVAATLFPLSALVAQPSVPSTTPPPPATAPATAPATTKPAADTTQAGALRVFVDCKADGCDLDFIRTELGWVNVVRDRLVSDVLLLVTTLPTGAGGTQFTVAAIGQAMSPGRADTTTVVIPPNEATDAIRRQLTRTFGLMLAPYAIRTPLASRLSIGYVAPTSTAVTPTTVNDPWNFWVYRLSANGFGNGEQRQSFTNTYFSVSANRVTADLKVNLDVNLGYDQSRYQLSSGEVFTNLLRNYGANALVAKSLGGHWTVGAVVTGEYSDYNNYALNLRVSPALEWNLFDYAEATRRQLTAYYHAGAAVMEFQEPTIYGRTMETRPFHALTLSWNAQQPWGSVNTSLYGSQYLHDPSKHSYGLSSFLNLRITKGLALNLGGNYSRVNDQLYLRRGTLSDNQVIARQEALATNYRYFVSVGVSYTFGSIFNAVVNPRFGRAGGGGGNMMMFSY